MRCWGDGFPVFPNWKGICAVLELAVDVTCAKSAVFFFGHSLARVILLRDARL
jgi:hypothetical protein